MLDRDALCLSRGLSAGEFSSADLMAATLERIDALNPDLNAIVSLRPADALMAEARAADKAPRRGWLHGMPVAIKDLAAAKGLPFTRGSPIFAGDVAIQDDPFVRRLKRAGAIVIGKTNVPAFGLGTHTTNPVFGATRNPYDTSLSAGGSSGGAGAALAARLVSVADGSDAMGSLRNPAAWNNVYGFRPSIGLVPPEPGLDAIHHSLSTIGPMARSPMDLEALLTTLSDGRFQARGAPERPRIGWLCDWSGAYAMAPGIIDLAEEAIGQMRDLGWSVEAVNPSVPAEMIWDSWTDLRSFLTALNLGPHWRQPEQRAFLNAQAQWEIERGLALTGDRIERALVQRQSWLAALEALFARFDALLLPATQCWPFPVGEAWPAKIAGRVMDTYHRYMEVMIPVSLAGLPAIALPAGFSETGLPGGVQLFGPRGSDTAILSLGRIWHAATDWPNKRPAV
ncbi:MAG: amidase [Pseudomonadota bacterium]